MGVVIKPPVAIAQLPGLAFGHDFGTAQGVMSQTKALFTPLPAFKHRTILRPAAQLQGCFYPSAGNVS